MVRDPNHKHYNPNAKSSRRNRAAAGLSLLGQDTALRRHAAQRHPHLSAERKIGFYAGYVCLVNARYFAKPTFALRVFRRQQMASRGTRPQDFATGGDLEAFRHCFARFAACDGLRHMARKLIRVGAMTNALL